MNVQTSEKFATEPSAVRRRRGPLRAPPAFRRQDALRWKRRLVQAHRGGPRDPAILQDNLVLVKRPDRAVVLFDDVMASGGHMVACYRRMHEEGLSPIAALVIGRATPVQQPKMLGWQEELLPVDEGPLELDF